MIKLSDKRIELVNLKSTIQAIDDLDSLIKQYSENKPGPAYVTFTMVEGYGSINVQFDRAIILVALKAHRAKLVEYMADLGIEVD